MGLEPTTSTLRVRRKLHKQLLSVVIPSRVTSMRHLQSYQSMRQYVSLCMIKFMMLPDLLMD